MFGTGAVTYANEAKERMLGVRHDTLAQYGAVSSETAAEMAQGIRAASGADIGVGITGIAGPTGGTPDKPVGTVFLGCANAQAVYVQKLVVTGRTREVVRITATQYALDMVRRMVMGAPMPQACQKFALLTPAHMAASDTIKDI